MLMLAHAHQCAKRHDALQVPTDMLKGTGSSSLSPAMTGDFRKALEWHIERHGTKIADLVAATGVSRDVINKLRARPASSTTVENALLIASFYGKTVNQFIACEEVSLQSQLQTLIEMLPPEEQRIVAAQIRGLLSQQN